MMLHQGGTGVHCGQPVFPTVHGNRKPWHWCNQGTLQVQGRRIQMQLPQSWQERQLSIAAVHFQLTCALLQRPVSSPWSGRQKLLCHRHPWGTPNRCRARQSCACARTQWHHRWSRSFWRCLKSGFGKVLIQTPIPRQLAELWAWGSVPWASWPCRSLRLWRHLRGQNSLRLRSCCPWL